MRPISAVIITLNEERNIARCLESLRDVADEVLVADSGSTDRTAEICRHMGATVVQMEWKGYSGTKNAANQLARYDLILSMDADEALSPELAASIREARSQQGKAFRMARLTNYCGHWIHHTGWYPDVKLRLFDRREFHWDGLVHEVIVPEPPHAPLLRGDILHHSYSSVSEHAQRLDRYTTLGARALLERGSRPSVLRLVFSPFWMFIRFYFIRLGFLDGRAGLIVSVMSAYGSFLKHAKHLMGQGR
jgi:glycosyltransferase involved in cell wall biosynthesis